ncbi:MAG: DUF3987 domain-containing protein [Gloeocapsa sp. DLM2.Bin57]|nr:MAG: DUF3987 domain-containing protein [Gloeocapsa sp. DLM2.Bin57]
MKFPQIDQKQALRQLELLGFEPTDKIYFRFFYPASHPNKAVDGGRKLDKLNWRQIESHQSYGRGAYLVVNGGGHKNVQVKFGRALFYEHDNLDKEIQKELWRSLNLPEPTLQIDTGGKSIHSYWVFNKPIPISSWIELQKDLLEYSDADRAIKNPARVMRLAGAWHISFDTEGKQVYQQSVIVSDSGKKYSQEELRRAIPKQETQPQLTLSASTQPQPSNSVPEKLPQHPEQIKIPVPQPIPLIECCRQEVRDWINTGVPQGSGRNNIAIQVGLELVGVERHLLENGQTYSESGSSLFAEYCRRSGMSQKEEEERWQWCLATNATPSCTPDGIANCIKGWYWREHIKPQKTLSRPSPSQKDTGVKKAKKTPLEEVIKRIDKILDQHLPESHQHLALLQLSKELDNYNAAEVRAIACKRIEERHNEDYLEERKLELEQLESWEAEEYLPFDDLFYDNPKVAQAFMQLCKSNQKLQPQYFLGILAIISSLLGTKIEVKVPVLGQFRSNLNIALVGESGEGKSIVSKILLKSIYQLQNEVLEQYQKEKESYEQAIEHWEAQHRDYRGPKPRPESYITTSPAPLVINEYSREGIVKNHAENKNGILIHQEELVSIGRSQNMYRQGKGDDRQFINNLYDGGTISRVLKSERTVVPKTCVSIFGGIQPEIILREMGDFSDPDGQWSRYNFLIGKEKQVFTDFNQQQIDISPMLYNLYKSALLASPIECQIDSRGLEIYNKFVNELEDIRWKTIQQGLRAVYSKATGEVARIALNLHAMNCLLNQQPISPIIPAEAIEKAIKIKKYFLRQMLLIRTWGNGKNNSESGMPVAYREIKKIARRLGKNAKYLTTRIVQQARSGVLKDFKAEKLSQLFQDMAKMGIATLVTVKRSVALVIDDLLLGESSDGNNPPPDSGKPPKPTPPHPISPPQDNENSPSHEKTPLHSTFSTLLPNVGNVGGFVGGFVETVQTSINNGFNYFSSFVGNVGIGFLSNTINYLDLTTIPTSANEPETPTNTEVNKNSTNPQHFNKTNDLDEGNSDDEIEIQRLEALEQEAEMESDIFIPTEIDEEIKTCVPEEKKCSVKFKIGAKTYQGLGYFAIDGDFYIDLVNNLSLKVPYKYIDLVEFLESKKVQANSDTVRKNDGEDFNFSFAY